MSSVPTIESVPPASRWPWLSGFLAGEWRAWIFVGKSLLAIYLAAWLAMWLQLEQPSTTMITVSIVMHPHSGMVLAKSFYRAIGTLAGSLFGLALMSLFPQQRELFLLSLSLWVALCAGGATLYRNFMSYGFVLAGYTAAIVTLPAINNPLGVFDSAVMRVSEVLLGIVVAAVVSDLVWPERLRLLLRQSAQAQFNMFIDFVRDSTAGHLPRAQMEHANLALARAAVRLEDMRASVIFEDPEVHARSTRMRLLNQRYMAAATSFQSLHHLINRLQRSGSPSVADALIRLYRPLAEALSPGLAQQHQSAVLASRLAECVAQLPARVAVLRAPLMASLAQLEFDTGAVLLQRFATELRDFAVLEGSLREAKVRGSVEKVHFLRGNDIPGALVGVLRTFLTMAALSAFWLASGWPFGASAMLLATIFSGLLAASPSPLSAATHTLLGYAAGMLAAFVVVYGLLPGSNDFVSLIGASAGFMLIGPYLSTRDTLPGVGAGYTLGFVYILALKNPMVYDPAHFLNDGIAQVAGLALAGAAFILVPSVIGTSWQRTRQFRRLREQAVLAATAPLEGLAWRFESLVRDLFQQVVTYTRPGSDESRNMLAWALAVLESGRTMIELRQQLATDSRIAPAARNAATAATHAIARLYHEPDAAHWREADAAVHAAIVAAAEQPLRLHLYQLRSALRDDESPFAAYIQSPSPESVHAA
ncbi:FUSC family protein [Rhodanobacter sp. C01]|uniref:FUSC family protein n=1 Tax=Rhodanobacter sp. C01 TaxID=1945856 RepID=UPI000985FAA7|nr:FUSC family protein [Rhodanobacter sp. C01]OOG48503.1 fusaric acid resistance protein [Rhodanobacter sp. C01]